MGEKQEEVYVRDTLISIGLHAGLVKRWCKELRSSEKAREMLRQRDYEPGCVGASPAELMLTAYAGFERVIAIEEMAELIVELCEDLTGAGDPKHIAEEMADVEFTQAQMKLWYANSSRVKSARRLKEKKALTELEWD